jgi:serine/threonine-protein kinase
MSPEQCRGKAVDHRTDVYSLGVMTHEVLTGRQPFDGESVMDVLVKHMAVAPPRMTAHCAELPRTLDEPVLHMLEKEPEQRPSSAGTAIDALVVAAREAGLAVGPAASARAAALPVAGGSDPERAQLAQAQTVVSTAEAGRTFMPAERDVASRPRRRTLLVVAFAMAGIVGGAAAVVLVAQSRVPTKATGDVASTLPPPPSAPGAALAPLPPSSAALSVDVAVTVQSNVAGSSVWLAGKRVGDAPGPLMLPRGGAPVTLLVKAEGYAPSSVDVVPAGDLVVAVRLTKVAATAGSSVRRVSKDLENPF